MIIYELFGGQEPFPNINNIGRLIRNITDGVRPEIPEDFPAQMKDVVKRFWSQSYDHD
jgi:hypothetical protein